MHNNTSDLHCLIDLYRVLEIYTEFSYISTEFFYNFRPTLIHRNASKERQSSMKFFSIIILQICTEFFRSVQSSRDLNRVLLDFQRVLLKF